MEGVGRLYGGCGEILVGLGGFLHGVGRLSGGCFEAVLWVWKGCMEGVGRLAVLCGYAV